MVAYKARQGLIKLQEHIATTTESSHTFTTSIDLKKYKIYLLMTGGLTAALSLQAKWNARTDYDYNTIDVDNGTVSGLQQNAGGTWEIFNSTLASADTFIAELHLSISEAAGDTHGKAYSFGGLEWHGFQHTVGGSVTDETDQTITSIEVKTSTSTWKAGTKFNLMVQPI